MKRTYIAPVLTVVSFKVEQGFTVSSVSENCTMRLFQNAELDIIDNGYNASGQQNWSQEGNHFFGNDW